MARSVQSIAVAVVAAVMSVLFVFCLAGCDGRRGNEAVQPTEAQTDGLTEAQRERILELAAAFRQYGEFSNTGNTEFARLEYILFCLFSDKLDECEVKGFGKLSSESADEAICGVFGDIKIMDVMRRKYDADADQTYYFRNGSYYIMRTDNSAYTYTIKSVREKTDDKGVLLTEAEVLVQRSGAEELVLTLTLVPDEGAVYRMSACTVNMCY